MDNTEEENTNVAAPEKIANTTQEREEKESKTTVTLNGANCLGDNQYFFEDQVFFVNKAGRVKFGLVIETCDSYSDDENDEDEKLNRGEVRIAWYPSSHEHIRSESTIGLADRTLMPGDVVRRMTAGCNPQRGYVRDIKITADVRVLKSPYVIKNVAAERLRPLSVWQRDCTVCLDSWVGSAKDVDERAILMGSNGVRFEIESTDFYHFKEASTSRRPSVFSPFIFFPGNIVSGRLPSLDKAKILTPDIPLLLNRKGAMLRAKFVVESVRTEGVIVQWQCKALSKVNSSVLDLEPPKPYVDAEQLSRVKRLNVFESCVLQMADRSYLTYEPKDQLITKAKWEKEIAVRFKEMLRQQRLSQSISGKSKEQIKISKETTATTKTNSNTKNVKTQNPSKENLDLNAENDGDWLTTTTATDTSDQSSGGGDSEYDEVDEAHSIDRSDLESITTNTGDEECAETNSTNSGSGGGGGAIVKKLSSLKNLSKKISSNRHKHQNHARQQGSTNKWLHKNAIYVPMNMSSLREGKEVITETLLVYSTVGVVWQDGTVEDNIPSTELYPIHHLDNHEFFPGDFTMLSVEDPKVTFRDYGVIQTVDHQGRTARVKWFKTYAPEDEEGAPTYKGESEVSVYDLKDHPDFTYRPGGMVIRVSNFVGEDASCTAGQVLDNCIDGRVKVAWDDGRISCCWPQDLYDVGHHEQHEYGGDSDSWETQSENSNPGGYDEYEDTPEQIQTTEKDIVLYIDRAIKALVRFEEILITNPHLQERTVMRKLLHIYKTGRYLDRLLQTSFFHEDHFLGLIKRVDKESDEKDITAELTKTIENPSQLKLNTPTTNHESSDLKTGIQKKLEILDLTSKSIQSVNEKSTKILNDSLDKIATLSSPINESPKVLLNINFRLPNSSTIASITSPKSSNNSNSTVTTPGRHSRNCTYSGHIVHVRYTPDTPASAQAATKTTCPTSPEVDTDKHTIEESISQSEDPASTISIIEDTVLLASALLSIEKAYQVTTHIKSAMDSFSTPQDDSGTFSRSNSDVGATVGENENPVEEIIGGLLAKVDKNLIGSEVFGQTTNSQAADTAKQFLTPSVCCVSFCKKLCEQIEKCKVQIEQQFNINTNTQPELNEPFCSCDESSKDDVADEDFDPKTELEKMLITNDDNKSIKNDLELNNSNDVPATDAKNNTTDELNNKAWIVPEDCFKILSNAPKSHKFISNICEPSQPQQYFRAVQCEHRLLKTSLPKGIWLRFYEDRIDLLSVMMEGPKKTPYENGLYFFDMQLGRDYPKRPPVCHYISYCVDRLNPNLYEEGKVCVSLLGTWSGRDVEVWGPNSTLLQVLVSIQGLILVPEPYFNEAGYEKQKGSLQGFENSRMYNEMVVIKMTQATLKMLLNPPEVFKNEILEYYKSNGLAMYERIRGWMELSKSYDKQNLKEDKAINIEFAKPDFPLLTASRGFCLTLESLLKNLQEKMLSIANGPTDVFETETAISTLDKKEEITIDSVATEAIKTNEENHHQS